ncbi:MAG: hypothetical protein R3B06_02915 [Kofleriaceae bacterium]
MSIVVRSNRTSGRNTTSTPDHAPRRPPRLGTLTLLGCFALLGSAAGCVDSEPGAATSVAAASAPAVVVVSDGMGDVLASAAAHAQVRYGLEVPGDARLVYANVDQLGLGDDAADDLRAARLAALQAAKAQRTPMLFESNEWDVARLHQALALVFPEVNLADLGNVTVLAEWDARAGAWRLTDTTLAEMVDYLGDGDAATIAQKQVAGQGPAQPAGADAVEAIGTQQANWLLPFAEAAYSNPLTVTPSGAPAAYAGEYSRGWSKDVVKIYRRTNSGSVSCVVTWQGTRPPTTWAGFVEWLGDFSSVIQVRPFYLASYRSERVGAYWNTRLSNQRRDVNLATKALGCANVHITGHSLGGAMAQLHAHYYAFGYQDSGIPLSKLRTVVAWNPARVGNAEFKKTYRDDVIDANTTSKVFCRDGDPVRAVPTFLQHTGNGTNGCDVNGVNRNRIQFWLNHNLPYWYQCASTTSC